MILFLLEKKRNGYGASKITPCIHALLYHVPFFVQKYGSLNKFSCQSVEKNNDVMKTIHFRKTNKVDGVVDAMAVRKRMELNFYADRERPKRKYDKLNENYWEYQICKNKKQKCRRILSEIAVLRNEMHHRGFVKKKIGQQLIMGKYGTSSICSARTICEILPRFYHMFAETCN